VAFPREGEVGGEDDDVVLYAMEGVYRMEAIAKAEEVEARTSVPGCDEFTGYAGRGVGMLWSPPLLRDQHDHLVTNLAWTHQYALSISDDPTWTYRVSSCGCA